MEDFMKYFELPVDKKIECEQNLVDRSCLFEGFVFTMETNFRGYYMLLHNFPDERLKPFINGSKKNLVEHVNFICDNNVDSLIIYLKDINFLSECESVRRLKLFLPKKNCDFNFEPLYTIKKLKNLHLHQLGYENKIELDFENLSCIEYLFLYIEDYSFIKNISKLDSLKALDLRDFNLKSIEMDIIPRNLNCLKLYGSNIKDLKGIENSTSLERIELNVMDNLVDISDLSKIKNTLKILKIDDCDKIKDFSVLNELKNLEYLELCGRNKIKDLDFLNKMDKLKIFKFSFKVENGDLSNCLKIPHVECVKNFKFYNLRKEDMPISQKYKNFDLRFFVHESEY